MQVFEIIKHQNVKFCIFSLVSDQIKNHESIVRHPRQQSIFSDGGVK